ncbi:uncharacterized protein METZ01_LOCUS334797, partial [marine metagenome]
MLDVDIKPFFHNSNSIGGRNRRTIKLAASSLYIPKALLFGTSGKHPSNIWNSAKAPSANS